MNRVEMRPLSILACLVFMVLACQGLDPAATGDTESAQTDIPKDPSLSLLNTFPGTTVAQPDPATVPVGPAAGAAAEAPDLVMMTFNIRYSTTSDGVNAWTNRRAQAYALIKNQDPDLIGFQEVLHSQLQDLQANVTGYTVLGVGRDDGKTAGEYSPIFFRTARFRGDTSGTFWFSDTPAVPGSKTWGNTTTRICTWARLVDKNTSKGFYHFNLHIDHLSQPSREKSMLLLAARIGEVKHPQEPIFVTGDFNSGEANVVIRFMKGQVLLEGKSNPLPFLDSYRQFDSISTAVSTRHDFTGNDSADDKIDYIFVLPRIKTVKAAIIRSNVNGLYPSDHFPVTASLVVPEWASTSIRRAWP